VTYLDWQRHEEAMERLEAENVARGRVCCELCGSPDGMERIPKDFPVPGPLYELDGETEDYFRKCELCQLADPERYGFRRVRTPQWQTAGE